MVLFTVNMFIKEIYANNEVTYTISIRENDGEWKEPLIEEEE